MPEVWTPIIDFDGYEVSSEGRVRSSRAYGRSKAPLKQKRLLRPTIQRDGYLRIDLRRDGQTFHRQLHCLVLESFVGPCPPGMECAHDDGVRTNCALDNLQWKTRRDNHADKLRHGTHQSGEANGAAKLSAEDVRQIRAQRGFLSQTHLAHMFGVTNSTIHLIHAGRNWRHAA